MYTLFLSSDGCFNCPRLILPKEDNNDYAVMNGAAYVPSEEEYLEYLRLSKADVAEVGPGLDNYQDVELTTYYRFLIALS